MSQKSIQEICYEYAWKKIREGINIQTDLMFWIEIRKKCLFFFNGRLPTKIYSEIEKEVEKIYARHLQIPPPPERKFPSKSKEKFIISKRKNFDLSKSFPLRKIL